MRQFYQKGGVNIKGYGPRLMGLRMRKVTRKSSYLSCLVKGDCGHNDHTCCSPVWGFPICATAHVEGCWYSGSEYLYQEYHAVAAQKTVDASYAFTGYYCSGQYCYPEYDYPRHASGSFSDSIVESKYVHLAQTYIIATWSGIEYGLPDSCRADVYIGAGGQI